MNPKHPGQRRIARERQSLLTQIDELLEIPMIVLGFVWLGLLIYELIWETNAALEFLGVVIWAIFLVDFSIKFLIATPKTEFLKKHWLTTLSLLLPALRIFRLFRVFRALRALRGIRLVRVLTSLNRGIRALGASFGRRGFGYVLLLTALVILGGAAGMYSFEREANAGIKTYGDALWWTAMMITTIGSDYFPRTGEGRILCFLLALYGFAVFGYVTASLATFFVDRDAENSASEIAGGVEIRKLRAEVGLLRDEIKRLVEKRENELISTGENRLS